MARILVVDDVRENQYLLSSLLQGHGHEVLGALNGGDALALALASPPDLIISDVLMPVMDGFELCRRCKQDETLRDVPFVIYTATYTDPKDERLALALGADRFLLKPQTPDQLLQAIHEVLSEPDPGAPPRSPPDPMELLQLHNEALVRKLEEKIRALEAEIATRKRAEAEQARAQEQRRRLEDQLQQAQRLESIGRLAGGVAHDFNNLLSVILLYADASLRATQGLPTVRADLEEIRKAGERAMVLTHQLLVFGRQQPHEPKVLDLNRVIGGLENMLRRILGAHVIVALDPSREPAWVLVDPGQIEQVLVNLAMNARDAMPEGGAFTVATTLVTLDETHTGLLAGIRPGPCVLLAVSDTGTGMDAATLAHIFEPFFTTKEKGKGSGLGLSSVHGIVRQSGGDLSVDSEPGRGATFRIFFPRANAGEIEPAPAGQDQARLAGDEGVAGRAARVLLVEDESAVGRIVERILREAGYQVHLVSSGVDALLLGAGLAAFDLLLTDVMMPGMNGFELSAQLTARYPTLRTLFLSGHADEVTLQDRGPSPTLHLLRKPFTAAQLTRRVREVLDGG